MAEKNKNKEVNYLNRDFQSLRNALIDFAKQYFPLTYQDFNEASPGMMFIEMASYVGDVLNFYIDSSLKESLLLFAEEDRSVIQWAQALGYKPKLTFPASAKLDVYQIVPSTGTGTNLRPDYDYALVIEKDSQISSEVNQSVTFRTLSDVDFTFSSSQDPTEVTVFEVDNNNIPTFYLLKKKVQAVAGQIRESEFTFDSPERFSKVTLPADNIIDIIDAEDSDGNIWHHVPFLAQDTVFQEIRNVAANDPELSQFRGESPYLLKLLKTARRFTSRIRADKKVELQFGSGISDNPDELLIPNPTNVGSNIFGSVSFGDNPIDPTNFLFTKTYGQAPGNTTLTVRYAAGGGFDSNVNQNELTVISRLNTRIDDTGLDPNVLSTVRNSIAFTNPEGASGGRDGETVEEVRQNALAHFPTQLRAVTKEDYITRVYSMPARFGSVAKAYIVQDDQLNTGLDEPGQTQNRIPNPLALNLYVIGYDKNRKLTTLNEAVKENLKTYLGQYRMLTDAINIKNGFIINIGVEFQIVTFEGFNKREVVLNCIDRLKDFFSIDKWQFNEPIILSDIQRELFKVRGVQSVVNVNVINKIDSNQGYSGNVYGISEATRDGIIYPSLDPSIFEVRFPNKDIKGRSL